MHAVPPIERRVVAPEVLEGNSNRPPVVTDGGKLQPVTEYLKMLFPACGIVVIAVIDCADAGPLSAEQRKARQVMSLHFAIFHDLSLPSTRLMAQFILDTLDD